MKKILSVLSALILIITMFSSCKRAAANIEDYDWMLYSVVNLNENGAIIAVNEESDVAPEAKVVDVVLTANDGELVLKDKTNGETYTGAYEEMLLTDNSDDYKIFLDGKEGYINSLETVYQNGDEEPALIITIDGYDLYFCIN